MKKYIIISGFNLNDNNRGTAALGYGSISFLFEKGLLKKEQDIIKLKFVKKFWKNEYKKDITETVNINGYKWKVKTVYVPIYEKFLLLKFKKLLPFTHFGKIIHNVERIFTINGGDGFSDIYGTKIFLGRLLETNIAILLKIPLILLPQTLGPFKNERNYKIAKTILKYSEKVFIRDDKFIENLIEMGINYEITRDLSFYMQPQVWDINIEKNAVGINVSGLAYSNNFKSLSGQFELYPKLINSIVLFLRKKGNIVYLIPHSYNYYYPEENNDDLLACRAIYSSLEDKKGVVLIDRDLISPEIKYLISKMKFFIGTRMHANFAAIYTGVPLFGLAYSYKFEGAFNSNGLNGNEQTALINNITDKDIPYIMEKIESFYIKICD